VCGRVVTTWSAPRLASYFSALLTPEVVDTDELARYNVAPTSMLYVVRDDAEGRRWLDRCLWGLVPRWARDPSGASKLINARAESLFERPTFRPLMARHRCLVPIDGFYEWGPDRRPHYIHPADDIPLAVAGLWTTWHDPSGRLLRSCTLLTTDAIPELAPVHHRMPVAVTPDDRDTWLTPEPLHPDEVATIVERSRQWATGHWTWHEVSRDVNRAGVDRPALLEPLPAEPAQGQLFDG